MSAAALPADARPVLLESILEWALSWACATFIRFRLSGSGLVRLLQPANTHQKEAEIYTKTGCSRTCSCKWPPSCSRNEPKLQRANTGVERPNTWLLPVRCWRLAVCYAVVDWWHGGMVACLTDRPLILDYPSTVQVHCHQSAADWRPPKNSQACRFAT